MPRPPIQHHKHIISLAPETLEAIEDIRKTWLLTKAIRAAGEATKGVLGHPVGFTAVSGVVAAFLIAMFVKPEVSIEGRDLEKELVLIMMSALPVSEEARQQAADNLLGAIQTIRKFLTGPAGGEGLPPIDGGGASGGGGSG